MLLFGVSQTSLSLFMIFIVSFTGTPTITHLFFFAHSIEFLGYNVKVIEGSYNNIKITTPEDLKIGEEILNENKKEIN